MKKILIPLLTLITILPVSGQIGEPIKKLKKILVWEGDGFKLGSNSSFAVDITKSDLIGKQDFYEVEVDMMVLVRDEELVKAGNLTRNDFLFKFGFLSAKTTGEKGWFNGYVFYPNNKFNEYNFSLMTEGQESLDWSSLYTIDTSIKNEIRFNKKFQLRITGQAHILLGPNHKEKRKGYQYYISQEEVPSEILNPFHAFIDNFNLEMFYEKQYLEFTVGNINGIEVHGIRIYGYE